MVAGLPSDWPEPCRKSGKQPATLAQAIEKLLARAQQKWHGDALYHQPDKLTAKSKANTVMPLGSRWYRISSASRRLPLLPATKRELFRGHGSGAEAPG